MDAWQDGDTLDKYVLLRRLHSYRKTPAHTDVWKAVTPDDPTKFVVLKVRMPIDDAHFCEVSCHAQNEVATLDVCRPHPNIASYLDFFRVHPSGELVVVFPFYEHGSLEDYMNSTVLRLLRQPPTADVSNMYASGMPMQLVHRIFVQIVNAVSHMHSRGVAHRDLKLGNICVQGPPDDVSIVIIDTEYAVPVLPPEGVSYMYTTPCGTLAYAPIEIFSRDPYDPRVVDVWCIGVCMFIMMFGELPYTIDMKFPMNHFKAPVVIPEPVDSQMRDLLNKMLTIDPEDRITLDQVRMHPAFMKLEREIEGPNSPPPNTPRSNKSSSDGLSDSCPDEISSPPPSPTVGFEDVVPVTSPRSRRSAFWSVVKRFGKKLSQRRLEFPDQSKLTN
ncbi:MAG: serine/threonine-protein kinase [Bdellovibrionales bacterium]